MVSGLIRPEHSYKQTKGRTCGQKIWHEPESAGAIMLSHGVGTLCRGCWKLMKCKELHDLFVFYRNPSRGSMDWKENSIGAGKSGGMPL